MKVFLMSTVIAMLAAGIYGTIDLTLDVKNGTLVEYQEEEDLTYVSQFAEKTKGIYHKTNVKVAQKKVVVAPTPTLVNSFLDLSFEDFSRGEPPMYLETMLLETVGKPDSVESAEVETAINDTLSALAENTKKALTDSASVKEERKFSLKLYSRGRPPKKVVKEEAVAEIKAEEKN